MYKTMLVINVWDGRSPETSSTFAALCTETELPFAPFPGLSLQLPGQRQWTLKTAAWNVTEHIFHCETDDLFINPLNIDDDFDEKLNYLVKIGWKLLGCFPNDN